MTKRNTMIDIIKVNEYTVAIERLHNTRSGAARFRAVIIYDSGFNAVYTFSGHYATISDEARWIVKFHEDHINDLED